MATRKQTIFLLIFAMVLWGLSWPFAKVITPYASEYTLIFWRFILSALSIIPLMLYTKQSFALKPRGFIYVAFATLFLFAYSLLFFFGLHHGLSGLGGVIVNTLNPIFTFIIIALLGRKGVSRHHVSALIIAFIGGSMIMRVWEIELSTFLSGGNLVFLVAALLWSGMTVVSDAAKTHIAVLNFSFYIYLGVALLSFGCADKAEIAASFHFDLTFWAAMGFISVIVTALATSLYFKASTILGSAHASSFVFLVPVSAVIGSYLFLNEIPTLTTIVGGTLCIIAVGLINQNSVKSTLNS